MFPNAFLSNASIAFREFLRRLSLGEDTSGLLTPEFSRFLYDYLGSIDSPSNVVARASIQVPVDAYLKAEIRDVWLHMGPPGRFAPSLGKFGGLIKSADAVDPKSMIKFIQLPFTSLMHTDSQAPPMSLSAEAGLQITVDVEMRTKFRFGYQDAEMNEHRSSVVRFQSQAFEAKRCADIESRNQRIFAIRENLRWKIADIDYTWSKGDNVYHG